MTDNCVWAFREPEAILFRYFEAPRSGVFVFLSARYFSPSNYLRRRVSSVRRLLVLFASSSYHVGESRSLRLLSLVSFSFASFSFASLRLPKGNAREFVFVSSVLAFRISLVPSYSAFCRVVYFVIMGPEKFSFKLWKFMLPSWGVGSYYSHCYNLFFDNHRICAWSDELSPITE